MGAAKVLVMVNRTTLPLLSLVATVLLAGCWTPPSAEVQPRGPSGLIQKGVAVESAVELAIVQSVDPDTRMIALRDPASGETRAYRAGPKVHRLNRFTPGTKVRATIVEELTVYVSREGLGPPGAEADRSDASHAKVLSVDPSYRLLTLQTRAGQTKTVKVGLTAKLRQMQPGDDVVMQPLELVSLSARKR